MYPEERKCVVSQGREKMEREGERRMKLKRERESKRGTLVF